MFIYFFFFGRLKRNFTLKPEIGRVLCSASTSPVRRTWTAESYGVRRAYCDRRHSATSHTSGLYNIARRYEQDDNAKPSRVPRTCTDPTGIITISSHYRSDCVWPAARSYLPIAKPYQPYVCTFRIAILQVYLYTIICIWPRQSHLGVVIIPRMNRRSAFGPRAHRTPRWPNPQCTSIILLRPVWLFRVFILLFFSVRENHSQ